MDDDITAKQAQPARLDPIVAYHYALTQFNVELADLLREIEAGDAELAGITASDAVGALLSADAASKRLAHELGAEHPLIKVARLGLAERIAIIDELLNRVRARFASPSLLERLSCLRQSLELACPRESQDARAH